MASGQSQGRSEGQKVVQVLLVGGLVVGVVYLLVITLVGFSMTEPDRLMTVKNRSGRALLIERATEPVAGASRQSMLVWGTAQWFIDHHCERDRLVARDLQGAVLASREGACGSDTWLITKPGLPEAPRYQPEPVAADRVEARLVVTGYAADNLLVAWWRALPRSLERAAAAGAAAGVSVHGPFVEKDDLVLYLRGPDADTVLELARAEVLRPAPGPVKAFVSAPGEPAPDTGTLILLQPASTPSTSTR